MLICFINKSPTFYFNKIDLIKCYPCKASQIFTINHHKSLRSIIENESCQGRKSKTCPND